LLITSLQEVVALFLQFGQEADGWLQIQAQFVGLSLASMIDRLLMNLRYLHMHRLLFLLLFNLFNLFFLKLGFLAA